MSAASASSGSLTVKSVSAAPAWTAIAAACRSAAREGSEKSIGHRILETAFIESPRQTIPLGPPTHDCRAAVSRRRRQTELFDAVADLIAVETQELCRSRLVAAAAPQRLVDQAALDLLEV